jgi:hypothetical protein
MHRIAKNVAVGWGTINRLFPREIDPIESVPSSGPGTAPAPSVVPWFFDHSANDGARECTRNARADQ